VCALGRAAFEEFDHVAETCGFDLAIQALETPARVQSKATYGIELLVGTPCAETKLDNLQASWAKCIIGARTCRDVRGSLAVRVCGWPIRLGTLMLERAVICLAKLELLPAHYTSRHLTLLALQLPCVTLAHVVCSVLRDPRMPQHIPRIRCAGVAPDGLLEMA